ncbi:hypothetical protein OJAV_G00086900 [Oryzias javanicus]|uniref:VWFA domain-containing protein n=1 Tax=Oryzias javanicus TaxID=123683 RepID=A0A437CZH2_ORYJA|nr:hypothetical protein OJAV_G00086900 [Oryzias javanicus]
MGVFWESFCFVVLSLVNRICVLDSFNVGTADVKIFSGSANEEFGYTVQQATNSDGKWLLVGAPWSGYSKNRKGDVYKCPVSGSTNSCDKLSLQDLVRIPDVTNVNVNMSLGLTLTRMPADAGLLTCGPLWGQQCGDQNFYPGVCAKLDAKFQLQPAFSDAVQKCGGPMDIVIVLDGSNSIYPWEPMRDFVLKLIPSLDIGPQNTQVSVIQYAVQPQFEIKMKEYDSKEQLLAAASKITQMSGTLTNTFNAIEFASQWGFNEVYGARPGASKVMVVVTDGESHDADKRAAVIAECEKRGITRFGIAVLEAALSSITGTLGNRIFNIEGTGKGGDNFQMEMSQVGFSAHFSSKQNVMMLGAVGAYAWSGTVVHHAETSVNILPSSAFERALQDRNHSSLLGYSVTTISDGSAEYFVAGAPRSNHSGQVLVYTINAQKQASVLDSQRGKQIGSYFGSVLCPLDVDKDGVTDLLLVGAPMYMGELKKEEGRVYLFSVNRGFLNEQGSLNGPPPTVNSRFGTAISVVSDLDLDGYSDVVVGAPLEDNGRGVVYIYNGEKKTLKKEFSQRIVGSKLDAQLKYFGRALDSTKDLNGDSIPDISIGAYGKVVQLWSRGVASVTASASFSPDKINIFNKQCNIKGRALTCFNTKLCFTASFKPKNSMGPIGIFYTLTLDASLQDSHFEVYVQETPDFVNSLSLKVEIEQENADGNPVLDIFSPSAFQFFIPFTKDCGSDEVCMSDLVLSVKTDTKTSSSGQTLVGANNQDLSFDVSVKNKQENAYNTRAEGVQCTSTQADVVTCQVGYPVLKKDQEVKFSVKFNYNLDQLQNKAEVAFQAKSDGGEENPADNDAFKSISLQYDTGIVLSRQSNINFYVADTTSQVVPTVESVDDIGPEFNFTVKVSTGVVPVSLLYLTISLPIETKGGNPLLYLIDVKPQGGGSVNCDSSHLIDPLKIAEKKKLSVSFTEESLRGIEKLDCKRAKCEKIKCILKDTSVLSHYFVEVKTRIWNGTFLTAVYQTIELTSSLDVETSDPNLLAIGLKQLPVTLTISKPGETADVPVGVIVGSAIAGVLLLALAVGVLYKVGFFKRKYQQLQKEADDDEQSQAHPNEVL